jgi:hypothetical protein
VPAPDVRVGREIRHGSALPFPFAMILMVVVAHPKPLASYKRQLLWGLSGAQRL